MGGVHQGYDPGGHGYQDRYGDQRQYQAEKYPPEGDDDDREEDEDYSGRTRGLERCLSDYVHLLLRDDWTCPGRAGEDQYFRKRTVAFRHRVGSMIPVTDLSCPGPGLVVDGAVDAATSAAPCV
jgi:hypothetical protein